MKCNQKSIIIMILLLILAAWFFSKQSRYVADSLICRDNSNCTKTEPECKKTGTNKTGNCVKA